MREPVPVPDITDIYDFYHRWPDLRRRMADLCGQAELEPADRVVLGWMMEVIDRVGPDDLGPAR